MTHRVAVVIPAFNAAAFLPVALRSLEQQSLRPEMVVVVDDGSTDGTAAVCEQFGVHCVRQEQRGPGAARNRGVAETGAEFVAFLDADDWFAPAKLERCVGRLVELGATTLATDAWMVVGDHVLRPKNDHREVPEVVTLERLLQDNPVICSTVVVRREVLLQVGGFDEDPQLMASEDYDLWVRLSHREPIAYLAEPLSFYRSHPGSLGANSRFVTGVDLICQKLQKIHGNEAHFRRLMQRRQGRARLDLAWDLLQSGRVGEGRELIREAWKLGCGWSAGKMWLRSLLGPR